MKIIGLPRSSYYYARKHPKAATRPDVHEKVKEIFNRTANGCGHRQILMRLRREFNIIISKKTVLKVMQELGLVCKIRRKGFRKYSSFKGVTSTVPNLIARDFKAEAPFTKIGTDVTEFALPFGKAYLAQVVDFHSNEILAYSISQSPNMLQQNEMFDAMVKVLPPEACPILHSDMGWQYQNPGLDWMDQEAQRYAKHVSQGQLLGQRCHRAGIWPYEGRVLQGAVLGYLRRLQERSNGLYCPLEHEETSGAIGRVRTVRVPSALYSSG